VKNGVLMRINYEFAFVKRSCSFCFEISFICGVEDITLTKVKLLERKKSSIINNEPLKGESIFGI
jgi:hypothetical protein